MNTTKLDKRLYFSSWYKAHKSGQLFFRSNTQTVYRNGLPSKGGHDSG